MNEQPTPHPYAVTIEDLESSVHVAVEDQTTEQPSRPTAPEEDEERRALRLAGGV